MQNKPNPTKLKLLPPKIDSENPEYNKLLMEARIALAELKGYSFGMPNPLILLSPAILRESLVSSEIENIHTTMLEVLQNQLLPETEQKISDKEVLRYREAVLWGFNSLQKYPISSQIILGVHKSLILNDSGTYRKQQNAIYNPAKKRIVYVPPVASEIPSLISNWEKFVNKNSFLDPLIKTAIAHYQLEAIHPFGDGNGRTGRILMVLQLIQDDILRWPILYISGYINDHRDDYYKLLRNITKENDWNSFITFMLKAFKSQAAETQKVLFDIVSLFEKTKEQFKKEHRKIYSADLVEALFSYPIITPVKLGKELKIHYTTASRYLNELASSGVLHERKVGKYHLFANKALLKILVPSKGLK
jgi:Fic family protein